MACGQGRRCTEEENRLAWMGLACRWKGDSDMGEARGARGPGEFWEDGQDGPKKTFQDNHRQKGIDVAPAVR